MKSSLVITLFICTALGRVLEHSIKEEIIENGVPAAKLDVHKNDEARNQAFSTLYEAEVRDAQTRFECKNFMPDSWCNELEMAKCDEGPVKLNCAKKCGGCGSKMKNN